MASHCPQQPRIMACALHAFVAAVIALTSGQANAEAVPNMDPDTYVEPPAVEYWGDGTSPAPFKEPRLNADDLTKDVFDQMQLDGKIFVVDGVGKDWPMSKWDCEFFQNDPEFKKAEMTPQYITSGANFVGMGGDWKDKRTKSGAKDKDAPQFAPFYWGIKDVQYGDAQRSGTWKKSMLKRIKEHVALPHFMNKGNKGDFDTTPEFWFAQVAGAGAKAHMDTHVQATISLQLAGTKRWRMKPLDPRKAAFLTMIYKDGDVYEESTPWAPHFNVTLGPGQALFFPPGVIHETLNLDSEGGSCAASVTFQFTKPMATRYYRRFLPRVRRTADIHEAWPLIAEWACLAADSKPYKEGKLYKDAKADALSDAKGTIGARFKQLDLDGDNHLSKAELDKVKSRSATDGNQALDLLGFHDLNEDGSISREEFAEVFGFWSGTVKAAMDDTPKKWRKYQLTDMGPTGFNIEDLPGKGTKAMLKASKERELAASTTKPEL